MIYKEILMKIVGLITEYNPFHNGHLYHIEESKRLTGADMAVVVMSGDYVQRGTPAIMPKRLRAEMALKCGAAAVFELPVCYAAGSAEISRWEQFPFCRNWELLIFSASEVNATICRLFSRQRIFSWKSRQNIRLF